MTRKFSLQKKLKENLHKEGNDTRGKKEVTHRRMETTGNDDPMGKYMSFSYINLFKRQLTV